MSAITERISDDIQRTALAEITHGPFANPYLKEIMKEFGPGAFGRASVCCEFEAFLHRIIGNRLGGAVALEIGTFNGLSAVILSQFFAKVICVSIDIPQGIAKHNPIKTKHAIRKHLGLEERIEFIDVSSNLRKAAVIRELEGTYDFAYSDGDHAHDAEDDFNLVKGCGRVLHHESQGVINRNGEFAVITIRPNVTNKNWCGEFQDEKAN